MKSSIKTETDIEIALKTLTRYTQKAAWAATSTLKTNLIQEETPFTIRQKIKNPKGN